LERLICASRIVLLDCAFRSRESTKVAQIASPEPAA
jgi:hypothetical protein